MKLLIVIAASVASAVLVGPTVTQAEERGIVTQVASAANGAATGLRA